MQDIQYILWDWNGTLIDDIDLCVTVCNKSLKKRQLPLIDRDFYRAEFGFPVIEFYKKIGFDFATESYADVSCEWISAYKEAMHDHSYLHHDIKACLEYIQNCGLEQGILSACEEKLLNQSIIDFKLDHFFHQIHGTDNVEAHGKDALARKVIAEHHCQPAQVLLFGDTIHDFEVAQDVGMHCILIADGHQNRKRLEATGATVVSNAQEALQIVKKLLP